MSSGAPFKLIANDGKADRMLMATDLLKKRIADISCAKRKMGLVDISPSLVDIEKTHVLFVNARFKPFAALAYEYQKATSTGSTAWGQPVQFSIPQFGDFLYDFVANVRLAAVSCTAGVVPAFPSLPAGFTTSPTSTATKLSNIVYSGAATGANKRVAYEFVTQAGEVLTPGVSVASNFVRYCEFPGERLFKKVKFEVNGNPLDEYTSEAVLFHRKFRITPEKLPGWKRLVGQEVPREAWSDLLTVSGASRYPVGIHPTSGAVDAFANVSNIIDALGAPLTGGPTNSSYTSRRESRILDGPQTPKATQPALEMWIPLLFWFNTDSRLAIPSVAIPFGQRFVTIDLATQAELVSAAPGNLFLRLTVETFYNSNGLVAGTGVNNYKVSQTLTPYLASNSVIDTTQAVQGIDLYCNNIFVSPEIHDIYIKKISFNMIRVFKQQSNRISDATGEILMSQLKWPLEYFYAAIRPVVNIDHVNNANSHRDWHRLTQVVDSIVDATSRAAGIFGPVAADTFATANAVQTSNSQITAERYISPVGLETVDTLSVKAHGIIIYNYTKSMFYRDYQSFTYGGSNIMTPEDKGALMVNFALHPGSYQPSGHLNASRIRELYVGYTSSYVSSSTPGDLLIVAKAINFLMIADGSAILRYST